MSDSVRPMDSSPPGSSIPGILQARILEWVAISFFNACTHAKSLQLCLTLCDTMDSYQATNSKQLQHLDLSISLKFLLEESLLK